MKYLTILALTLAMTACTAAGQPIEAQLATACNSLATGYRTATIYRAQGKLSPSAIQSLTEAQPVVLSTCDADHPPANLGAALTAATDALAKVTAAQAGVK